MCVCARVRVCMVVHFFAFLFATCFLCYFKRRKRLAAAEFSNLRRVSCVAMFSVCMCVCVCVGVGKECYLFSSCLGGFVVCGGRGPRVVAPGVWRRASGRTSDRVTNLRAAARAGKRVGPNPQPEALAPSFLSLLYPAFLPPSLPRLCSGFT